MTNRSLAISLALLTVTGCSRSQPAPQVVVVDASIVDAALVVIDAGKQPPQTIDAYCKEFVAGTDTKGGFPCVGEPVHPTCVPKIVKKLPTLGEIERIDEKDPDGTHTSFVLANAEGRFATLLRIATQECDLGDPASISLALVSTREDADAGALVATIVFDSLEVDPPLQGGSLTLDATRYSIRCRAGEGAPACDEPTKLGTFVGPMAGAEPPPFSKWKKAK